MESRLRAHPTVADCALLGVPQAGGLRVAAVTVPTDAGREVLAREGRRELSRRLAEHLAPDFDRVLLPRAWRFVDELPRDARGKTSVDALRQVFAGEPAAPRRPHVVGERRGPGWLVRELRVPARLAFLEGHFEGMPLVAGVVQLGWAVEAAEALVGGERRLVRVEALKFSAPLLPEARAELRVEARAHRVSFRIADAEHLFASGRLVLEPLA
jgi:3-hydroxymyristoyl/3-hydroxydecanoyl-(acyl carrier protein) dehydratase